MTWELFGTYTLTSEWQFTPQTTNQIFRVIHHPISNISDEQYLKSVITQAYFDDSSRINIFQPQRLTYRPEIEIINYPLILANQLLGFKRIDNNPNLNWVIDVEYFKEDTMPLFDTVIAGQVSNNVTKKDTPATITASQLLTANPLRKGATLFNNSSNTLYLEFGDGVSTTEYAVLVAPGKYFEMPFGFTGDISGVWDGTNGMCLAREFV